MVNITNEKGRISITSEVLTYLAGVAATGCFGVKGMIGRSKDGGALQLLRRESMSRGVTVHNNDDGSISLELHIGVDHGVNMSTASLTRSVTNSPGPRAFRSAGWMCLSTRSSAEFTPEVKSFERHDQRHGL